MQCSPYCAFRINQLRKISDLISNAWNTDKHNPQKFDISEALIKSVRCPCRQISNVEDTMNTLGSDLISQVPEYRV